VLLNDADGPNRLTIQVTGYQFPDAPDPAKRFSWHMVGGEVQCQQGSFNVCRPQNQSVGQLINSNRAGNLHAAANQFANCIGAFPTFSVR